jgi:hypothetical protein
VSRVDDAGGNQRGFIGSSLLGKLGANSLGAFRFVLSIQSSRMISPAIERNGAQVRAVVNPGLLESRDALEIGEWRGISSESLGDFA